MFGPEHYASDVASEIVDGLRQGTIALDSAADPTTEATALFTDFHAEGLTELFESTGTPESQVKRAANLAAIRQKRHKNGWKVEALFPRSLIEIAALLFAISLIPSVYLAVHVPSFVESPLNAPLNKKNERANVPSHSDILEESSGRRDLERALAVSSPSTIQKDNLDILTLFILSETSFQLELVDERSGKQVWKTTIDTEVKRPLLSLPKLKTGTYLARIHPTRDTKVFREFLLRVK